MVIVLQVRRLFLVCKEVRVPLREHQLTCCRLVLCSVLGLFWGGEGRDALRVSTRTLDDVLDGNEFARGLQAFFLALFESRV